MTREDLIDWLDAHGCKVEYLPEKNSTARVVKFINPKYESVNAHAYIDTPIDSRKVKDYTVYRICMLLFVPIPDHVKYLEVVHNTIERDHFNKDSKK